MSAPICRTLRSGSAPPPSRSRSVSPSSSSVTAYAMLAVLAEVVNGEDVRMRQRGDRLGLALEARERGRIGGQVRRQDLDRDLAIERRVARAVDLAHAARAERGDDLVLSERCAAGEAHREATL